MKKLLLFALLFSNAFFSFSQETLFQDNFESGSSNWTLNGGTGQNVWVVNNSYAGYMGLIPDTPSQPAGIFGSPASNYLHINNTMIAGLLSVFNANFETGSASNQDAVMSANISTTGKTEVTFSYWYLSAGAAGVSEGKVYYSVDNGTNWTLLATHAGVTTWTQATHSIPAWDNQPTLKFRFNWINGSSGNDPAFSVDDVLITAEEGTVADEITGVSLSDSDSWCEGTSKNIDVSFTASGTYNAGNDFIAELSDAAGSFASATTIGTLASTATGALTINASIGTSIPAGAGYRIRVRSTDPAVISDDNGTDLVIHPLPAVTLDPFNDVCINHSPLPLTGGSPAGGVYSGTGVSAGTFTPSAAGLGNWTITYTYADPEGCVNAATSTITVDACVGIETVAAGIFSVHPNPVDDRLYVNGNGIQSVVIYDLLGKKVLSFEKVQESYDVRALNRGAYFVKIKGISTEKTIKIQVR